MKNNNSHNCFEATVNWTNKNEWEEYVKKLISEYGERLSKEELLRKAVTFDFEFETIGQ